MNNSSKIVLWIAIIVVVVGIAFWFYANQSQAPTQTTNSPVVETPQPNANNSASATPAAPAAQTVTVTYTDQGFSPATVTIHKGDVVVFKNNSSGDVWPASDPHPAHNGYPTTGGCVGSTFDACKNLAPGGTWSFTFNIVGSWGYHNHVNPRQRGTVIVQ